MAAGVGALLAEHRLEPSRFARVVHATTLFTNALIERKGGDQAWGRSGWLSATGEEGDVAMRKRQLGRDLSIGEIGLGCMGMSEFYGPTEAAEATATLHRALDLGVTLLDTADGYGMGRNEELLGPALRARRAEVVLTTTFGIVRDASGAVVGLNGRPEDVRAACDTSLRRLGGLLGRPCARRAATSDESGGAWTSSVRGSGSVSYICARRIPRLMRHFTRPGRSARRRAGPCQTARVPPGAPYILP